MSPFYEAEQADKQFIYMKRQAKQTCCFIQMKLRDAGDKRKNSFKLFLL